VVHDEERKQGYDNGRATPDGVIDVAAFAVLVSVTWFEVGVALRVAGAVDLLDVLGEKLGPVVRRGQITVYSG
jgi:Zn-dependent protease